MPVLTPTDLQALWLSVKVAGMATFLTLPPAFLIAWALEFGKVRGRALFDGLVNLPLVLPPVVIGYLLLLLFSRQGIIGKLLSQLDLQIVFTWKAAVVACIVLSLPLVVRSIRLGMEQIDPQLLTAARCLGATRLDALFSIVLPLCIPALATGATLAFARSLGEFGATIILAGNIPGVTQTIPLAIYDYTNSPGGEQGALTLCLISIGLSYLMLLFSEVVLSRFRRNDPR